VGLEKFFRDKRKHLRAAFSKQVFATWTENIYLPYLKMIKYLIRIQHRQLIINHQQLLMKHIVSILIIFLHISSICRSSENDSLLRVLDQTIREHQKYFEIRELRIKGLKSLLQRKSISDDEKYKINELLFEEYTPYSQDSAEHYLILNLELSKSQRKMSWLCETKLQLANLLTTVGSYKEAFDVLSSVDPAQVPMDLKVELYTCSEHIYSELANYSSLSINMKEYKRLSKLYKDSLMRYLEPRSDIYQLYKEYRYMDDNKFTDAEKINAILLAKTKEGTPEFAYATYRRAIINRFKGNKTQYEKYLILSAISDIKAAVTNNASITLLALRLYEENHIERAYEYVQFSLKNAKFFNTRLRMVEISNILPLINSAYEIKSKKEKENLRENLLVISLLSLSLFLTLFFINRQRKKLSATQIKLQDANYHLTTLNSSQNEFIQKLKELNIELSEANLIKEQYIGHFLNICSTYIDKLESLIKKVNKHISSGKTLELFEYTKSKSLIDHELIEFYDNFDRTFLHLFPNFVEDINSLLVDEGKIQLKKGDLLNTELRIFALIRLGITDSSKIAALLRYSVNTIYNYRVKLKNKSAVPRDEFEGYVGKIMSKGR